MPISADDANKIFKESTQKIELDKLMSGIWQSSYMWYANTGNKHCRVHAILSGCIPLKQKLLISEQTKSGG